MTDMTSILSRPASSIEAPKQLPVGQYLFRVMSVVDKDAQGKPLVSQAGNPKLDFLCQAEAAIEVNAEELAGVRFPAKITNHFTITENSLYRLVNFLTHLGLSKDNSTVSEMIAMAPGNLFRGGIIHQSGNKPGDSNLYANISETFPAS